MGFVPVVLQYSLTVYEIFIALVSVFQMTCLVTRGRIAYQIAEGIFNPRRACAARVTVLGLCVCYSTSYFIRDYSCHKRY